MLDIKFLCVAVDRPSSERVAKSVGMDFVDTR
jgi:hypothetical protein